MTFHADMVYSLVTGGFGALVLSYAVRTFPKPTNSYGLWVLGVIQFILLNLEQGKSNFSDLKAANELADGK